MPRSSVLETLAAVSDRAVERAVTRAGASMDTIYRATAGPGPDERQRPTTRSDELLGRGDQQTVERVRAYGPFLSPQERRDVNRRATRAGGQPVFDE